MKKQTLKKLSLKKAQIVKLENIKGGAHAVRSCLGLVCIETFFFACPQKA